MRTENLGSSWMVALAMAVATALSCGGGGGGGSAQSTTPIRGDQRTELCGSVGRAPEFTCPSGTNRRGKPPPDGNEMWCQRWDGTRHGPYRRFPPGAPAGAAAPDFVTEGAVIGAYAEGEQTGPWWTHRAGADEINVAYYQEGRMVQRVHCRP